jgi:hydroxymethylbilane synthase
MSEITQLKIATRESALALWQAEHVASCLRERYPTLNVSLVPMTTKGDQILDRPLSQIGGKGLFLKELEQAMLAGEADCAVHSLKDVPMQLEQGFALAAIMQRASAFDALIVRDSRIKTLMQLPEGARVGSSSQRRQVQLHTLRPDFNLVDLRGNVNTRLRKLDAGEYDAIVLAQAGLDRLGFADRIAQVLAAPDFLPAAGQGALALECLSARADVAELLAPLADHDTSICVQAERSLATALFGSCQMPIAAYAELHDGHLRLQALLGDDAARQFVRGELSGRADQAQSLGMALANSLRALAKTQGFTNQACSQASTGGFS